MFKRKKKENEYSFIWYKRMKVGNKTFLTQPFRTKIKAKTYNEAKEKVTDFALSKMELVIINEDDYKKVDLSKILKGFDYLNKQMNDIFKNFK